MREFINRKQQNFLEMNLGKYGLKREEDIGKFETFVRGKIILKAMNNLAKGNNLFSVSTISVFETRLRTAGLNEDDIVWCWFMHLIHENDPEILFRE